MKTNIVDENESKAFACKQVALCLLMFAFLACAGLKASENHAAESPVSESPLSESPVCEAELSSINIQTLNSMPGPGESVPSVNASNFDSANDAKTIKSWTVDFLPDRNCDREFFKRLDWKEYKLPNHYVLRTGVIYGKWVAALQWLHNGKLVLTEVTPPYEYLTVLDPASGRPRRKIGARDVNHDGICEIAFLHQKLNDKNYHMYTVYSLGNDNAPELVWKSGGQFGDWINKVKQESDLTLSTLNAKSK